MKLVTRTSPERGVPSRVASVKGTEPPERGPAAPVVGHIEMSDRQFGRAVRMGVSITTATTTT
jgi:hypothetical protein